MAESECGDHFTYLGSVMSNDEDAEKELNTWLAKAALEDLTMYGTPVLLG